MEDDDDEMPELKVLSDSEDDDDDEMPDLETLSDSEDDSESDNEGSIWFTDVKDESDSGWDSEELSRVNWSESSSFVDIDLDLEAAETDDFIAQIGASKDNVP